MKTLLRRPDSLSRRKRKALPLKQSRLSLRKRKTLPLRSSSPRLRKRKTLLRMRKRLHRQRTKDLSLPRGRRKRGMRILRKTCPPRRQKDLNTRPKRPSFRMTSMYPSWIIRTGREGHPASVMRRLCRCPAQRAANAARSADRWQSARSAKLRAEREREVRDRCR